MLFSAFPVGSPDGASVGQGEKIPSCPNGALGRAAYLGAKLDVSPSYHCLVPGGGLSLDGKKWIKSRRKFFLPVKVMSRLFRGKFLAGIKEAFLAGKLRCLGALASITELKTLNEYLRPMYQKDWVVYAKAPFGGPEQVINYLGRYTHRVAISNERILKVEQGQVCFRYKDYAKGGKSQVMSLSAEEFIRRFLLHILPRGFHKIRYYGLLATRNRKTLLQQARTLLGQLPVVAIAIRGWEEMLIQIHGIDPRSCPRCQKGKMQHLELIPPSRPPPKKSSKLMVSS